MDQDERKAALCVQHRETLQKLYALSQKIEASRRRIQASAPSASPGTSDLPLTLPRLKLSCTAELLHFYVSSNDPDAFSSCLFQCTALLAQAAESLKPPDTGPANSQQ